MYRVSKELLAGLALGLLTVSASFAQTEVQTFFVPNPETQVRTWAEAIQSLSENDEIHSVISITATADETIIYYDHWEDGFEAEITEPVGATTEVWGDQDCSNGFTPLIGSCVSATDDQIFSGDVLVLESDVPVPGGVRDANNIFFDGGDKFATTQLLAVTRAAWPSSGVEAQLGGAVEVLDTSQWGSDYELPVGEGTVAAFELVAMSIMAQEDGTTVSVDLDADGTDDTSFLLDEGESTLVGAVGSTDVLVGATVSATSEVQLDLLTANEGTTYEGRWYSQFPTEDWSARYFSPVASTTGGDLVHLYIYNPGPTDPIEVAVDELGGCTDVSVGAGSFVEVALAVNAPLSAAELTSDGTDCGGGAAPAGDFFSIATVDRNETIHDWGYTLIPEESLTPSAVVGWAPGSTNLTENASPVWITPVGLTGGATTTIYVDYDGDGLGPLTVGAGTLCEGLQYDQEFAGAGNLDSLRLFEPDNDQTGTRIFTCDGTRITAAWGQDPEFSSSGQPQQLDMGTTVLPFASLTAFKDGALYGDNNGNGGLDPGDTILYTIRVVNSGIIPITDVDLIDTLDPNTTYVPDTTEVDGAPIADDVLPDTAFPLDTDAGHPTGYGLVVSPQTLLPGAEILITFVVSYTPLTDDVVEIINTVTVTSDSETFVDSQANPIVQGDLSVTKTSSATGQYVQPGQPITYTVTITNSGDGPLTGVTLTDPVPAGTTAVTNTTQVTGPRQRFVRDLFDVSSFSNNNGPHFWDGSWTETDADGGAQDPGAGDVVITAAPTGTVSMTDAGSAIERQVDLSAYAGGFAALIFEFAMDTGVDEGDGVQVELSSNGGGSFTALPELNDIDGDQNPNTSGTAGYDISAFIAADTVVRLRLNGSDFGGTDEFFESSRLEVHAMDSSISASDDFSSGSFAGGTNWSGPWVEVDAGGAGPSTGDVTVDTGELVIGGAIDNSLTRTVDLSGSVVAILSFDHSDTGSLSDGDRVFFEASRDGVIFSALGDLQNDATGTKSYDLTPFISDTTTIRFRIDDTLEAGESYDIDDVVITAGIHSTVVRDNFGVSAIQLVDGELPSVVLTADEFALAAGETITATFDVLADSPLGVSEITNVATADAFEDIEPAMATVTDPVDPAGGAIGDLVWMDLDGDGVHDIGEPGIPNVTVELRDGTCTPAVDCPTLITDADGRYLFSELGPGTYDVFVDETTLPSGLTISPGSVNPVTTITITSTETFFDVDFPYTNVDPLTAIIGDRVWGDIDADGVQDPGEIGISGVTLNLIGPGADGILGTADDAVLDTVTTGADGTYLFTGVTPGEYSVDVTDTGSVLTGFNLTSGPQSLPDPTDPITVIAGEMIADIDFGYAAVCLSSIGFEVDALGNAFALGQTIDDEFADWGLQITVAPNAPSTGPAMIFDSGTPTGVDYDLGSPNLTCAPPGPGDGAGGELGQTGENCTALGNVLIISEDGDALGPDDSSDGGTITFTFTHDVEVESIDFLDIEAAGNSVDFFDALGAPIANVPIVTPLGDNSFDRLTTNQVGVREFVVNLAGEGAIDAINFCTGVGALYTIRDRVWLDLDGDGVQDIDELGIPGVTVTLLDSGGSVVATAITDANGNFAFTNLPDGNYTISITDTASELSGLSGTTAPATADLLAVAISGGDFTGVDFGYNAAGLIGDRVWSDADGDGVQDPGEPGISGVTVDLIAPGPDAVFGTGDDVVVSTTTTGTDGSYEFVNRAPGSYQVDVTDTGNVLTGYTQTGDPSVPDTPCGVVCDDLGTTSIALGTSDLTQDFGYQNGSLSNVSGTVYLDDDKDGIEDVGEAGFSGVTLDLVIAGPDLIFGTSDDVVMATTTTDANGDYSFNGLLDGDYQVVVTDVDLVLDGYRLTSGLDEYPITVAGADLTDIDFGYVRDITSASIGDSVWLDGDGDGQQGPAEAGLTGVTVNLWPDLDGDGVFEPGGDDGVAPTATTVTDANGKYLFGDLVVGSYFVDVDETTLPVTTAGDLVETTYPAGVNPSAVIAASEGEFFEDADFGYVPNAGTGVLGDRVWSDDNGDGLQDPGEVGIAGVTIEIDGPSCTPTCTVTTGPDGTWLATGLAPGDYFVYVDVATLPGTYNTVPTNNGGDDTYTISVADGDTFTHLDFGFDDPTAASIGDTVYLDEDGDGGQDVGEPGLEGVTVNLVDTATGNILATTTTDDNGNYDFTGLQPGSYDVVVTDVALVLATLNNTQTAASPIVIVGGEDIDTADFGYAPSDGSGTIGSFVWHDLDGDGFVDLGEPGIEGVTVQLWLDDGDDVYEPFSGDDNLLREATTDEIGEYEFLGLPASTYWVTVTDRHGVTTGFTRTPSGGPFSCPGADDTSKEDACQIDLTAVLQSDFSADFGFEAPVGLGFSISGTVFEDQNVDADHDEPGEPVVPTATVRLYRVVGGSRFLIGTTTTDGLGDYIFTDLPPGDYEVETDTTGTIVDDYVQTTQTGTGGVQPVPIVAANVADQDFGFWSGGVTTTPVTLAGFEATGGGGSVSFTWTTATEVGNVGFNLWAMGEHGMVRINRDLVRTRLGHALEPQTYTFEASGVEGDRFVLEDRDLFGNSRYHGPFELGVRRGTTTPDRRPIDWRAVRLDRERRAIARAAVASMTASLGSGIAPIVELRVDHDGIHRVTYEQLLAAGADYANVPVSELYVSGRGSVTPIRVVGSTFNAGVFGEGAYFDFLGKSVDSLYTRTAVYTLESRARGERIWEDDYPAPAGGRSPSFYMETTRVENQNSYHFAAPGGDPWYDAGLLATSGSVEASFPFDLEGWVAGARPVSLRVEMWGVTNFPTAPDHHVVIDVNTVELADEWFDGLVDQPVEVTVPDSALSAAGNSLRLVLPHDTGAEYDLVHYDALEVTYPRHFRAREGVLDFSGNRWRAYRVDGLPSTDVVVYQANEETIRFAQEVLIEGVPGDYSASFAARPGEATFYVASAEGLATPQIALAPAAVDVTATAADFMIVAHGDFVDAVEPLAQARRDQGLSVSVIDVADVYRQFSYGVVDPQAIQDFLAYAHAELGSEYALLVGGDSYDYFDYQGTGSISFIPTPYAQTDDIVYFAPVDSLYVDFDRDGIVEMALGRLPVRTVAELDVVIDKTLAYDDNTYRATAVLAADSVDLTTAYSFTDASEEMRSQLPAGWQTELAYIDDLGVEGARDLLIDEVDAGVALTSYFGHSGPTVWSFESLFNTGHADGLANFGRPTVVAQWGCWNTYHVTPGFDTLGHVLMLSDDRGAAAVLGAATLTEATSERKLGREVFGRIGVAGKPIGLAVLEAKQALGGSEPELLDVLWGWTLLGDPTLIVQP